MPADNERHGSDGKTLTVSKASDEGRKKASKLCWEKKGKRWLSCGRPISKTLFI